MWKSLGADSLRTSRDAQSRESFLARGLPTALTNVILHKALDCDWCPEVLGRSHENLRNAASLRANGEQGVDGDTQWHDGEMGSARVTKGLSREGTNRE